MPWRALDTIHLGDDPNAEAGDIVPETYTRSGEERPVDFDRLLELGVVEPADGPDGAPAKRSRRKAADDAPSDDDTPDDE